LTEHGGCQVGGFVPVSLFAKAGPDLSGPPTCFGARARHQNRCRARAGCSRASRKERWVLSHKDEPQLSGLSKVIIALAMAAVAVRGEVEHLGTVSEPPPSITCVGTQATGPTT
jgi:hypothetical protein